MYNPLIADAEYVELLNTSTNFAFDLSSWRVNGLGYTFPNGSYIAPRGFIVLAKSRDAAVAAYGPNVVVFDEFPGNLQLDGETLSLIQPGPMPEQDLVIDKIRFESVRPWPVGSNGVTTASSIQLIDPSQDHSRPCNWFTRYSPAVLSMATNVVGSTNGGWRYLTYTGLLQGSTNVGLQATNFFLFLDGAGDVYVDDLFLVQGSTAGAGPNLLQNGDFETALSGPWSALGNHSNSVITTSFSHSGNASLHIVAGAAGGLTSAVRQLIPGAESNITCTLSGWFYATTNATNLSLRTFPGSGFQIKTNVQPQIIPDMYFPPQVIAPAVVSVTPGAANTGATNINPAIPPLWLNEVQPENLTGITNNLGAHESWLEIYNSGTNVLALDGYYLANNYTNLGQWSFPAGTTINPGEFKVIFADGQVTATTATELHTSFRLSSGTGSLALSRPFNGGTQVLDYISYRGVRPDRSYGSFPDGQLFHRQEFYYVTPGGTNNGTSVPINVFINEWMASNTRTLPDLSSGLPKYDDWFELYNPGTDPVDLGSSYLTDTLTDPFQYQIPAGYTIPPGGHLLVWADNEPDQNRTNSPDLHVNFQLNKGGEAIGLFAADGTKIDAVPFGAQTNDISMGRCPDGTTNIVFMFAPSPRAANNCPGNNTAPVLTPIGNKFVYEGQTVTFTASATDAEAPPQTLTFSLEGGEPAGAQIGASSGFFTWSTVGVPAPSTNLVTIRVADNGLPSLDDSELITIIVLAPLNFRHLSRTLDHMTFEWETIPGQTYRVEYKDNLNDPVWTALFANDLLANGSSLSATVSITGPPPHRFYRVRFGN